MPEKIVAYQSSPARRRTAMRRNLRLFMVSGLLFLLTLTSQGHMQAQAPWPVPVDVEVPMAPTPVKANGQLHLLYELHITNFVPLNLELTRVEVLGEDTSAPPLASYEDAELVDRLVRPGVSGDLADKRLIGGGLRAVVYLQLSVDTPAATPGVLHHRLFFKTDDANYYRGESVLEGGRVVVRRTPLPIIDPPLRGEGWLASAGFSNISGHRRSLLLVNGQVRIPQRFATDWARIGSSGQLFHGDPTQNESWYAYGEEVLAVADAVVVGVKDGIPENVPLSETFAVPITLETVGGNYILLDLGKGHFAFYGHLQPDSLRVKVGDRVRQGQALALLGNSGDSSGPHLHFHITNANSPLGAEGVPYVYSEFDVQGTVASLEVVLNGEGWRPAPNASADTRRRELPVEYAVVRFS
jgi:hypothetical protein